MYGDRDLPQPQMEAWLCPDGPPGGFDGEDTVAMSKYVLVLFRFSSCHHHHSKWHSPSWVTAGD